VENFKTGAFSRGNVEPRSQVRNMLFRLMSSTPAISLPSSRLYRQNFDNPELVV
jgi:hypothetical protein